MVAIMVHQMHFIGYPICIAAKINWVQADELLISITK